MTDEGKGFKVVDRRVDLESGEAAPKGSETRSDTPREEQDTIPEELPAIDFMTFVLSLGSSAMVHLGNSPHPETGDRRPNLALARQTIDILAMLQEKTVGNLTGEEERILGSLLTDLRIVYVSAANKK